MMVTLGTDAHKKSHTIVAVDTAGAEIGSVTVAATQRGTCGRCSGPRSSPTGSGRLRTAGHCHVVSRAICWESASESFACRPR